MYYRGHTSGNELITLGASRAAQVFTQPNGLLMQLERQIERGV